MIIVRQLKSTDDRSNFHCGNSYLDNFFVRYAGQNQFRHHIGITYVAVDKNQILGFVTVSASHIEINELPDNSKKKFPKYPLPILRMARLAVDKIFQRKRIGLLLLRSVFQLAWEMAEKFGCIGVVVEAKPEAINFYEQYGFIKLEVTYGNLDKNLISMFIPIKSIPKE
ncbi:GNAT family acetyltransferase [Candidatus Magnetomoraceae bacterium gMMP-15]